MVSGRSCFVLSRAKHQDLPSTTDTPVASTNLKCNVGNPEDSLCDRIQLRGVNVLLVPTWKNGPLRIQPHI